MKTCILIPTYNNAPKLVKVVEGVLEKDFTVFVVNDGSTDETLELLEPFKEQIQLISYPVNKGKGNALWVGFKAAFDAGYDSVITIDSDGQHAPEDIPLLLKKQEDDPGSMLMGSRDLAEAGAPGKSSFGNKFSNFWFRVETGWKLPDTQTGFRLYPLKPLMQSNYVTKGFAFEIETIVKLAWKGVRFHPVKITVDYPEDRITHFKPFKDFTKISLLNTWLFTLAVIYYIPKRLIRRMLGKSRY